MRRTRNGRGSTFERLESRTVLAANLVISEINYAPYAGMPQFGETEASASEYEFIEIWNAGDAPAALANMALVQVPVGGNLEGVNFVFSSGTLNANDRLVVVRNQAAYVSRYGQTVLPVGQWSGGGLSNSGEVLTLVDSRGLTLFQVDYKSNSNWPTRAAGAGASLEIKPTLGDPNDPATWRSSIEYGGSPGRAPADRTPRVMINEVLAHTDPPQRDAIELRNLTSQPIDLTGWYLSDRPDLPFNYFVFPNGATLPANGYLVVTETDFNPGGGLNSSDFSISERGEPLILVSATPAKRPLHFEDQVVVSPTANGISVGNVNNVRDDSEMLPLAELSLGLPNGAQRISDVIITEVNFHPADDDIFKEFIELKNVTNAPVTFADWRLEGGVDYAIPASTILAPNELIVVVGFNPVDPVRAAAFREYYGIDSAVRLVGPWDLNSQGQPASLSDNGETLLLRFPMDDVDLIVYGAAERIAYNDRLPWPEVADGSGAALRRTAASAYANVAESWNGARPNPGDQPFSFASAPLLALDTPTAGEIGKDGLLVRGAADTDAFRFTPSATGRYTFQATVDPVLGTDAFLRIFQGETEIAWSSSTETAKNAEVALDLTTGVEYVVLVSGTPTLVEQARLFNPFSGMNMVAGATGTYDLTVRQATANPTPWRNSPLSTDVNNDGEVSPIDALLIINRLNSQGAGALPVPPTASFSPPPFLDVNGDNQVSPIDALMIINFLNASAEGENDSTALINGGTHETVTSASSESEDLLAAALEAWWDEQNEGFGEVSY